FLKKSIIAGAALTMASSPSGNILMAKPDERVNLAAIGGGNSGGEILMDLYKTGLCSIVALGDVDVAAKHTEASIKQFPDVPRVQDFRQMFDKMGTQIDAVTVGVPDFSHFPITMMALDLGKHVYVEKPMARTFLEVELMMEKARKNPKLATQMGNQGHSDANYFQYKAWTEAGIIKDVTQIVGHMNMPRRWHGWDVNIKNFPPAEPIPSTIDWDLWQMQ